MKRILILTSILIFVAGLTGTATAQFGHGFGGEHKKGHDCKGDHCGFHGKCGPGGFGEHCGILICKKELELTDEQIAKITDINFAHKNAMIDLGANLKKAELKMKQVAHGDNPSKGEVLAAAAKINSIKGQMAEAKIGHKFDLKGVLNKEQLEKWKKCQTACIGKCGSGMGGHFTCSPGCQSYSGCMSHPGVQCDPAKCNVHGKLQHEPGCPKGK